MGGDGRGVGGVHPGSPNASRKRKPQSGNEARFTRAAPLQAVNASRKPQTKPTAPGQPCCKPQTQAHKPQTVKSGKHLYYDKKVETNRNTNSCSQRLAIAACTTGPPAGRKPQSADLQIKFALQVCGLQFTPCGRVAQGGPGGRGCFAGLRIAVYALCSVCPLDSSAASHLWFAPWPFVCGRVELHQNACKRHVCHQSL